MFMANAGKKSGKKRTLNKALVISKTVKDYSKDPFFVKKAKSMEAVLKKHGLPNRVTHA